MGAAVLGTAGAPVGARVGRNDGAAVADTLVASRGTSTSSSASHDLMVHGAGVLRGTRFSLSSHI